jgi:hypothetical protein
LAAASPQHDYFVNLNIYCCSWNLEFAGRRKFIHFSKTADSNQSAEWNIAGRKSLLLQYRILQKLEQLFLGAL